MQVSLPYGTSQLMGNVPESVITETVGSRPWAVPSSEQDLINEAFERPTIGPKLKELARGKRRVVIVTCDRTRSMPSRMTLPSILKELMAAGVDRAAVTVLVATGLHKGETIRDLRERLGEEIIEDVGVAIHDSDNQDQLVFLGNLRSGTPLYLNRAVVESDLLVVESAVEPHLFAGFTGGSKMILPGCAGTETILHNHSWRNVDDPRARYGVVDNPVRAEANEALRHLGKIFALNLVLDPKKQLVFASSGDMMASFTAAAKEVTQHSKVQIAGRPNVVITTNGGYPLDRNLYQCVKGIAVPEEVVRKGSRIIVAGECADGVAHDAFLELMQSGTPEEIYSKLERSKIPVRDQWQAQVLCRILRQNEVWVVTRSELKSEIESAQLHYAPTIEEALVSSNVTRGEKVLVAPEGPSMILTV